jgi:tetratricopeptide (TPR) repeat protein
VADHAAPRALEAHLVTGAELPGAVRRHLAAGCPYCALQGRRALVARRPSAVAAFGLVLQAASPDREAIGAAVDEARAWASLLRVETAAAPALLSGLLACARDSIEDVRQSPTYHSLGFAEHLCARSREEACRDPLRAGEFAELAVEVADTLPAAGYPPALAEDARALAWRTLGNALRVATDLPAADRAFTLAAAHLAFGCGAPRDRAEHLSLLASLRLAQARFHLAIPSLEQALEISRGLGDDEMTAKLVLKLAKAHGEGGEAGAAVAVLEGESALFARHRDADLALFARHAHACCLLEAGQVAAARRELIALAPVWRARVRSPLNQQRFDWLEARASWAEGHHLHAERQLRAVRAAFQAAGAHHDFALVSLDLAALYLEEGRGREVRRLAEQMVPLFETRELHRHALAALTLFEQAACSEQASAGWVRQLARYLRQSRHNPYIRFQPV